MKKILITGANGFIGRCLVEGALERGYEVWAGVRKKSMTSSFADERIRFIDLDYEDVTALAAQLSEAGRFDYIIHNAGLTKTLKTADFYRVNADYTKNLTNALTVSGMCPDKFLLMSSLSVYGPIHEKDGLPVSVSDAKMPDTHYGKSKLLAERHLQNQNLFPYIIFNVTGVYGPGDRDYIMQIESIRSGFDFQAGMKSQKLTFIYVKDLVDASFVALENMDVRNMSFIVSGEKVYTADDFSLIVKELLLLKRVIRIRLPLWLCYISCVASWIVGRIRRKPPTLNPDKFKIIRQRNWSCDIKPLSEILGFTPSFDLKKGLFETIFSTK
ncbi:MAG: NAD(P)-dependent oxidoreductase [Tannerella sp.]|jgi:nucleoside-diphosphate-sugar epimerase|nr:NAD(P)-dependent oxidoreductase [Tannerella sp.]